MSYVKGFCRLHLAYPIRAQKSEVGAVHPQEYPIYVNMSRVQEIHPCVKGGSLLYMSIRNYIHVNETPDNIIDLLARVVRD